MSALIATLHAWLPHLSLALSLAWAAYIAILAVWIVLQKREPIATLSWLLALALLPVIGFIVYHFLGPQRIVRQRLRRLRARARLARDGSGFGDAVSASPLMRLAAAAGGCSASRAQSLRLLVDGAVTFDALLADIAVAREHVHLEYYIFEPDQTGTRLRDALCERAAAGVQVRLLVDAIGSSRLGARFLQPLREAGVEVAFFHRTRLRLRRLWHPKINLRNHRKIVVIDGRIGYTGGINITDDENERVRADAYHDLHARLEGDVVRWLQLAFAEDWTYATARAPLDAALWPAPTGGGIRAQVVPAGPDSSWEAIHRVMVAAIGQASRRVWLATPYFVPGEAARMALTSAALRGIDVRLLVPRQSDSRLVTAAARSYFDELLAAGIRVFEYPRMLHTKALLVDEDVALIGSSNFDNRSFRLNFELCVLIEDAGIAGELAALLAADLAASAAVPAPRRLGFGARLAEASARLVSPLL